MKKVLLIILSLILFSVRPAEARKSMALVSVSVTDMKKLPDYQSETVSQAMMGTPVEVTGKESYWYSIVTPEGYSGWTTEQNIVLLTEEAMEQWRQTERLIVRDYFALVTMAPADGTEVLSDCVMGNILVQDNTPEKNGFTPVMLPDGRKGYVPSESVASLSNSYRLGGHEAPPAIMSVFVGTTLDQVLRSIEDMSEYGGEEGERARMKVVYDIPEILPDNTDRNRTSPFAFTGNRFEFRAVGSSVNVSAPMYVLNAAVAQQLTRFRSLVDERTTAGEKHDDAIFNVIRQYVLESKAIRFEGNGYSREWQEEALRRGLRPMGEVPEANKALIEPATVSLFSSTGILSDRELYARYEVQQETYTKKLQIEARVLGDLIVNHVVPTAIKFQNTLIENCQGLKDLFGAERMRQMCTSQLRMIEKISRYVDSLRKDVHDMIDERRRANQITDVTLRAEAYCAYVKPYMQKIRDVSDKLEMLVDDELWPLPKYREMLLSR